MLALLDLNGAFALGTRRGKKAFELDFDHARVHALEDGYDTFERNLLQHLFFADAQA
jgi:hypothetical protein